MNFYVIRTLNVVDGKIGIQIVKADTEEQAREKIPEGLEVLDVTVK